ncbi:MAG: 50S ribosomal protein L4 [Candidatus Eisenbacteria sp.]|nr:50S ribosomal protein L4 [Candidatus Eisenbacteria bacterium]
MASIYSMSGEVTGSVDLPEAVFGIEPNHDVLWDSVRVYLANQRQGSASTLNRSEVNKSGSKPWRQKGTGRARAGTARSPIWVGGGVIFGPKPKDYSMNLPKKKKRLAVRSALSSKAQDEELMVVDRFALQEPKTRRVVEALKNLGLWPRKCLLVTHAYDEALWRAARNLKGVTVRTARSLTPYEILDCEALVVDQASVNVLGEVLGG